ncbi:hypothetical protein VNO77_07047 [Canavalia gladiata]|uniref:Uncharacterized protein n=1 Tax=Canavalia gladiata TaxID=3824 RepID=A0AAN9R0D3_CANGL
MGGPYGTVFAPFSSRPFQSGPHRVHEDTCLVMARSQVGHHFSTSTRGGLSRAHVSGHEPFYWFRFAWPEENVKQDQDKD